MMQQFLKWLGAKFLAKQDLPEPDLGQTAVGVRPLSERPQTVQQAPARPKTVRFKAAVNGKIADGGPGKNVLIRSRLVREDTGTHDTLKILDEYKKVSKKCDLVLGGLDRVASIMTKTRK